MAVDREEVLNIAKLARLRLSETEVEVFREQLSEILDYVEKLSEVDTSEVEPTTHAVPLAMHLRADEPRSRLTREEVLSNAPDQADGHFRVPKVVEG